MKYLAGIAIVLLMALLLPAGASAEDPLITGLREPVMIRDLDQAMAVLFSMEIFNTHWNVGLVLRPDLQAEFALGQPDHFPFRSSLLKPSAYLGGLGTPMDEALRAYFETPRLISIQIRF